MITQKDKKRVAFVWGRPEDGGLGFELAQATSAWMNELGNDLPFKVTLLFEGTETARGWISAMREDDK